MSATEISNVPIMKAGNRPIPFPLKVMRMGFSKLGPVFPDTFGKLATKLWFSTRRKPQTPDEKAFLLTADKKFWLKVAGKMVPVYEWGEEGPVILLVHGWEGRVVQFRHMVSPLVAAGFKVVGFDAPGHGDATGNATDLEELRYLLSTLGANYGPLHGLLGHSFGGVSISFAMRHGLEVEKVVLINSPCDYEYVVNTYQNMLHLPDSVVSRMVYHTKKRFEHWPQSMEDMMNIDRNAVHFKAKALIIHDLNDSVISAHQGKRIADVWPGAEWMTTQGYGHSKSLAAPEVISKLAQFFSPS